jgi:HK97 family phage portal protein
MIFPKLFGRQPEKKASQTGRVMVMTPGQPAWSGRDYASFSREAYIRNVVAYQSVNKIADAVSSIRWTAWRGEKELSVHPALDLIRNPNASQSGSQYIREKVSFLLIAGNSYEESVKVAGRTRELYQLRPDRMKVIPGDNGYPIAYQYENNGRKVRWDVDPRTLQSDIRHLKLFNPLDDWYGLSPVEAASYAVDQHNESMTFLMSLLQNSARPSGALVMGGDSQLGDEQFNRLKAQMDDQYSGSRNAGRPMLLEGGLDWKQMGLSPTDMGIVDGKNSAARDIALAFGVPPQLLGIPGDNTYSNYQEARLAFWQETVIPLVDMIAADWSATIGDGAEIRADYDQVPAIVEKKAQQWEMADRATDLTINERRAMKGYEPIEGGDALLVNSSQISLSMATEPLPPMMDVTPQLTADDMKALAYGLDMEKKNGK